MITNNNLWVEEPGRDKQMINQIKTKKIKKKKTLQKQKPVYNTYNEELAKHNVIHCHVPGNFYTKL